MKPNLSRIPQYYHRYVLNVKENDINAAFTNNTSQLFEFFENLPEEKRGFRYAEGKWTITEMVQHLLDAERIFVYRALCFARKEPNSLPGFDENLYAENSKATSRKWNELIEEFRLVRASSEIMFKSFDQEQLDQTGIANGQPVYVEAIAYVIIGHTIHHINVARERYL
jgi:uncharacterized damage-inducible protein DinB